MNQKVRDEIIGQFKVRVIDESIARIVKCLSMLEEDHIWQSPNKHTNSIGHLILHLEGNAKQWILSTLGGYHDNRQRDLEFTSEDFLSKEKLYNKLSTLSNQLNAVVEKLAFEDLLIKKEVQCYHESVISILVHVIEHFSYHTGQITLLTKIMLDTDTAYFAGQDLNKTKQ